MYVCTYIEIATFSHHSTKLSHEKDLTFFKNTIRTSHPLGHVKHMCSCVSDPPFSQCPINLHFISLNPMSPLAYFISVTLFGERGVWFVDGDQVVRTVPKNHVVQPKTRYAKHSDANIRSNTSHVDDSVRNVWTSESGSFLNFFFMSCFLVSYVVCHCDGALYVVWRTDAASQVNTSSWGKQLMNYHVQTWAVPSKLYYHISISCIYLMPRTRRVLISF